MMQISSKFLLCRELLPLDTLLSLHIWNCKK